MLDKVLLTLDTALSGFFSAEEGLLLDALLVVEEEEDGRSPPPTGFGLPSDNLFSPFPLSRELLVLEPSFGELLAFTFIIETSGLVVWGFEASVSITITSSEPLGRLLFGPSVV